MITNTGSFVHFGNNGLPCPAASPAGASPNRMQSHDVRYAVGSSLVGHGVVHLVQFDDDASTRMSRLCRAVGIEARAYPNIRAFLQTIPSDAPACLIVHVGPPPADDITFLAELPPPDACPPMIVAADRADVRTAVAAMKAGAIEVFEQPLREHNLLEAVVMAMDIDRVRRRVAEDRAELKSRFARLTERERQVMSLVTQGLLNKQVAGDLGISEITVKAHRGAAMRKMGARSFVNLVRMADAISSLHAAPEALCR